MALVQILELLAIAAALLAAWYWYRAGDRPPRRISGDEELTRPTSTGSSSRSIAPPSSTAALPWRLPPRPR